MRPILTLLAAAACATSALAQQRTPGQRPALPDHWVPFDSLVQQVRITDDQRAGLSALHGQIDSIVRRGAALRAEMREELQRTRDRDQAQRYRQRLLAMQQRIDRLLGDLKEQLTEEQKTALEAMRPPVVLPQQRPGVRPGTQGDVRPARGEGGRTGHPM